MQRQDDILIWGATGFTGRLVARYLATRAPGGLRWSIGGRDPARLEQLGGEIGGSVGVVVGDALDPATVDGLAARARVVVSTVGPYARYGTPLVEACVRRGVSYCDITGETPWIRRNVDRFHESAERSGARIVHCCGFDSIPSDLGVRFVHEQLRERHGQGLAAADFYLLKARGGFSGGTAASLLNVLEEARASADVRRVLRDPYALNPPGERHGADGPDSLAARWDARLGRWTAPFIMAPINTRVVRRSNALLGYPYGREFRYRESAVAGGRWGATAVGLGLRGVTLAGALTPGRALLRRLLPSPGEGPSEKQRREGFFDILLVGEARDTPGLEIRARVRGDRDPGYGATSRMLAECALALALDELPPPTGVLTPAAAFGIGLLPRLRVAGVTFDAGDGQRDDARTGVG